MRIGVDFDNTVVSYEGVFYQAALEKNLIPVELSCSKGAIRDYLRSKGKEKDWTELQGYVYGAKMDLAAPYPDVDSFFARCIEKKIPAFIISHKTQYPFLGPAYDLHKAAQQWLQKQPFSPPAFFELTLKDKFKRISQQDCTVFIDDLPEVLRSSDFPLHVKKVLFDPHHLYAPSDHYDYATSWIEIGTLLSHYGF